MKKKTKTIPTLKAAGILIVLMTPLVSTVLAEENVELPILSLDSVSGGYKSMTARFSNRGDGDATNITWNITVNDVVMRLLREISVQRQGLIDVLYAHDGFTELHIDIPKGFGIVKVHIIAVVPGLNYFEAHIYAFVLGTRVFVLP